VPLTPFFELGEGNERRGGDGGDETAGDGRQIEDCGRFGVLALAAGKRLCDDPPARRGRRHRHQARHHSFRATGITAYLKNGGTLEKAAAMANRASTRTTQLHDRRRDELSLDEVERIVI
jgi:hypothetical protein